MVYNKTPIGRGEERSVIINQELSKLGKGHIVYIQALDK